MVLQNILNGLKHYDKETCECRNEEGKTWEPRVRWMNGLPNK